MSHIGCGEGDHSICQAYTGGGGGEEGTVGTMRERKASEGMEKGKVGI